MGYKYPKSTPWMLFSYSKTSNLYTLFVEQLIEGATPYMNLDLDVLKGMKIKVMFETSGEYQNIFGIRPFKEKIKPDPVFMNQEKESGIAETIEIDDSEVPF